MMLLKTLRISPLLIGLHSLFVLPALADNPIDWRAEAQLGFVDSRAQQQDRTINGRLRLQSESEFWRNDSRAQLLHTRTDNKTTKENYILSHQVDYQWTEQVYSLASGGYEYKRFATFVRQYDLLAGMGYRMYYTDRTEWDLEAGLGVKFTERYAAPYEKERSLLRRAASKWSQDLTENIRLQQEIIYDDTEDASEWRLLHSLAVRANQYFSLSFSHEWKRLDDSLTNDQQIDTITSLNLVFDWNGKR